MKTFILLLALLGLVACGKDSSGSKPDGKFEPVKPDDSYFHLVNEYREQLGLDRLKYLSAIEVEALDHSEWMAGGAGRFGHFGWKGRCKRLRTKLRAYACGEIVAMGQKTPNDVLLAWLSSPPHRAAIEDPKWTHTGIGIAKNSEGRLYWTQMFLSL